MTREQKLALVLGFAAVMVVGLLISDHLAAARSAELEDAPHDATVLIDATEGQAMRRIVAVPKDEDEYRGRPARRIQDSNERDVSKAAEQSGGGVANEAPVEAAPERSPPGPIKLVVGEGGGAFIPVEQPSERTVLDVVGESVADGAEAMAKGMRKLTGLATSTKPNGMASLNGADGRSVSREVSTEPEVVQHHVQANESLYKIAEKYYGDGNAWRRIAKDNAGRVGENGSVRQGVTLRIFDPTASVVAAAVPSKPAAPRELKPTRGGPLTYTVKSGDTLGEIAQDLLGTVRRQHELIALNRDVLKDPDNLRAGTVLKLPSS